MGVPVLRMQFYFQLKFRKQRVFSEAVTSIDNDKVSPN